MILDNDSRNKKMWRKKEQHIRAAIIGVIIAILFLITVIIFFRTQVWAIITGLGVIVGLIADLIVLFNTKGKE